MGEDGPATEGEELGSEAAIVGEVDVAEQTGRDEHVELAEIE